MPLAGRTADARLLDMDFCYKIQSCILKIVSLSCSLPLGLGIFMQIRVVAHMTVSNCKKRPCVAWETSSICFVLSPVAWGLPRWGEWPASVSGYKTCQHTATVPDKSITKQQTETVQVYDTYSTSGFPSCQSTWQQTLSLEGLVSLLTLSVLIHCGGSWEHRLC